MDEGQQRWQNCGGDAAGTEVTERVRDASDESLDGCCGSEGADQAGDECSDVSMLLSTWCGKNGRQTISDEERHDSRKKKREISAKTAGVTVRDKE